MRIIIFAGPSLYGVDLGFCSNLSFFPPARSGDLLDAVNAGARAIGLIDGLYSDCAAVWHKEILYALSKGVAVIGAASMGALRAAECESFGMMGIGEVFRAYKRGDRTSDADVAVTHAPRELGYRPLTIALVDVQATLETMKGQLSEEERDQLIYAAQKLHFTTRTWRRIVAAAGLNPLIAEVLSQGAVSVKTLDAIELLSKLQGTDWISEPSGEWIFQNTIFFQDLVSGNAATRG